MRVRAIVRAVEGGYVAECLDLEGSGEGKTQDQALASLRRSIEEREVPEAVAPPEETRAPPIEIVVVDEPPARESPRDPTGPGDLSSG
jgi:hypothetical protein